MAGSNLDLEPMINTVDLSSNISTALVSTNLQPY